MSRREGASSLSRPGRLGDRGAGEEGGASLAEAATASAWRRAGGRRDGGRWEVEDGPGWAGLRWDSPWASVSSFPFVLFSVFLLLTAVFKIIASEFYLNVLGVCKIDVCHMQVTQKFWYILKISRYPF